jgi:uncharacterized membrane protein HdeD (DUF308 family)
MEPTLARNWWAMALWGALAILFGALVFFWPALLWVVVLASFAVYALLTGALAIILAFFGPRWGQPWWGLLLEGIFSILAGALTLVWPEITELALLFLIAFWAVATGVLQVVAAIRLRKEIEGEWALGLAGVLSVLFGLALVALPGPGAVAIAWLIASYSVAFGVLMLALAFRLRSLARGAPGASASPATNRYAAAP